MKIVCSDSEKRLSRCAATERKVLLFGRTSDRAVGSIGTSLRVFLHKHKLSPDPMSLDFVRLALSVYAADQVVPRALSPDGWTRELELEIAVSDPEFWNSWSQTLNAAFQFLTTDVWSIRFTKDTLKLPKPKRIFTVAAKSISLLSGGMDSLIGAVDLAAGGERALLVSQVVKGDREKQLAFSKLLGLHHFQLTHGSNLPGVHEQSTRSRSIVFIGYGVMAATCLRSYKDDGAIVRIPENGFMSINPPLTSTRLGALSTRTTHPDFINLLQSVLDATGMSVQLVNPYQWKTKGEMLAECKNQDFIQKHVSSSTSCGRFVRTGYRHCGRCLPCLVRRAAFFGAGQTDCTTYKYESLRKDDSNHARFDDVRSAAMAAQEIRIEGVDEWLGNCIVSSAIDSPEMYRGTVERGMKELGSFLMDAGVK